MLGSPAGAKLSTSDFDLPNAQVLGAGAISYVVSAVHVASNTTYALKILSKIQLLQQQKVEAVMREKEVIYRAGPHPFIARLHGTMQSDDELYFVLERLPHGDLLEHIRRVRSERNAGMLPRGPFPCLSFADTRNMLAQVILGLERLFGLGCVLRDLKPENVCFDAQHRCVLIDFDTADVDATGARLPESNNGVAVQPELPKEQRPRRSISEIQAMRKASAAFCGTAQYVSPEMVGQCRWSYASDLWALGAMAHHMVYGEAPFDAPSPFECMKMIIKGTACRTNFFPELPGVDLQEVAAFKDFVSQLLELDPVRRLGVHPETKKFDCGALRNHPFMVQASWDLFDASIATFSYTNPFTGACVGGSKTPGAIEPAPFASLYEVTPRHSDEYGEYAYRSGGDNLFEKFVTTVINRQPPTAEGLPTPPLLTTSEAAGDAASSTSSADAQETGSTEEDSRSESSSDDDVVDDVGQRYRYEGGSLSD